MIRFLKKDVLVVSLLLLLASMSNQIIGQEAFTFQGPYEIKPYKGMATFDYILKEKDTIFNGKFILQRSNLNALLKEEDSSFMFQGNFTSNIATGPWIFQFGKYQSKQNTEVVDLQYNVRISGTQKQAKGTLVNGKLDGKWEIEVNQIEESKIVNTLFNSSILFKNGVPINNFQIKNTTETLVGRFLRDGLAHDEWVNYTDKNSESWFFKDGLLENIQLTNTPNVENYPVFEKGSYATKIINLDHKYLSIVRIQNPKLFAAGVFRSGIQKLLQENNTYYQKIDSIINAIGASNFSPKFRVKVPYYPLNETAQNTLDSLTVVYTASKKINETFLNDTQLHLLKVTDKETNSLYKKLEEIHTNSVVPLGIITENYTKGILEYVELPTLIAQLWPNGIPNEQNNLEGLNSYVIQEYATIESTKEKLDTKLHAIKRADEFESMEKIMIQQINNLNVVMDSVEKQIPKKHLNALSKINVFAESKLTKYSNTTDPESKLKIGRHLVGCFENLIALENSVLQLSKQEDSIYNLYQDQVWNPFMSNLMTESVKKRILSAYSKVVIPHLLEQTSTHLDCKNAKSLSELYQKTYARMLQLKEEDTRKLERKIKKTQDPLKAMRLLNILKEASK